MWVAVIAAEQTPRVWSVGIFLGNVQLACVHHSDQKLGKGDDTLKLRNQI